MEVMDVLSSLLSNALDPLSSLTVQDLVTVNLPFNRKVENIFNERKMKYEDKFIPFCSQRTTFTRRRNEFSFCIR
jgi:hypothetical protein